MDDLLSQYDSDKNNKLIKEVIGKAIQNKQKELDKITKEIESVKKQQTDGHYFIPLNKDPTATVQYIGQAVISILGDIIHGIGEATEHIKKETAKINETQKKQIGGYIGGSDVKEVNELANNLTKMIGQAKEIISNINKSPSMNSSSQISNSGLMSEATRIGKIALQTGVKISESMINTILNFVLDSTGNESIVDKSWQELSPELNKKLILLAGVLKEMSDNPATKEAIKEAAKTTAVNAVEIMKVIQPDINKVTDQAVDMVNEVASKSVQGMASTSVSVAQAFLAEIPIIGGILDLMIAIGKGFNALMRVFKIFVSRSSGMVVQGTETIAKVKDKLSNMENDSSSYNPSKLPSNENTNKYEGPNRVDNLKSSMGSFMNKAKQKGQELANSDAVKNAQTQAKDLAMKAQNQVKSGVESAKDMANKAQMANKVANNANNVNPVGGGSSKIKTMNTRKLRSHIAKSNKRLRKTIKLFHSTLPRMKYNTSANKNKK